MIREYVYLNGAPLAQIDAGSPQVLTYLHVDHLGTPRYGTNSGGTSVWAWTADAFGTSTPTGSATVNLRMPGQYYDSESGLFYNWNRYYKPAIGRYISSDPIGLAGGLNTFNYVDVSPVMYTDPEGLAYGQTAAAAVYGGLRCFLNPSCRTFVATSTQAVKSFVTQAIGSIGLGGVLSMSGDTPTAPAANIPQECKVHGNSLQSPRPTELYYLINRSTGDIDKIGITSNPRGRYSQSYLEAEDVRYETQKQYPSRLPAAVDEYSQLYDYFTNTGSLPRLNKTPVINIDLPYGE